MAIAKKSMVAKVTVSYEKILRVLYRVLVSVTSVYHKLHKVPGMSEGLKIICGGGISNVAGIICPPWLR
jgi:hypothetical protein